MCYNLDEKYLWNWFCLRSLILFRVEHIVNIRPAARPAFVRAIFQ